MNPVTVDIKDKLVSDGLGVFAATTGWGIYIREEPLSPDTTITLYDIPELQPRGYMDRKDRPLLTSQFQVRVRARGYEVAHLKLQQVIRAAEGWDQWLVDPMDSGEGDMRYLRVIRFGVTTFLGRDDKGRDIWVSTLAALRQEEAP